MLNLKKSLNTQNLIYFTIFITPLYLVKIGIFGLPSNILELAICVVFFRWILEKYPSFQFKIQKNFYSNTIAILLIFSGLFASTLANQNYRVGFGIIKGWFFIPLIFGLIVYKTIRTKNDIRKILKCIFYSASATSIIGIFYLISSNLTFNGRLQIFFLSPNHLAMFLSFGFLIGFYLVKEKIFKKNMDNNFIFYSSLFFCIAIALYFTYSYAAWLSIAAGLSVAHIFSSKNKKRLLSAIFLIIACVSLLFYFQFGNQKFQDFKNFSDRSSSASRLMIWSSAWKIGSDHWFWGIGSGNFQTEYLEYQKYFPSYLEWAVPQPHNLYLAFWLQSGLIGFFGFIFLIFLWFRSLLSAFKKQKDGLVLAAILFSLMLSLLFHGIFDTPYWKNDLSFLFWIIFFLGISLAKKPMEDPADKVSRPSD